MKALSLFSGVGGMDLGLERAGITTVAMCEIDPHARSVLARHWPDTPIYTDVTTFNGKEWHGRVDLVHGGSPCQDLSVAGRRQGLDGDRSGLFWHQCRIAAECAAPWILWENVPGALSSNNGTDFAAVLFGLCGAFPDVPADGWRNMGCVVGPHRFVVWSVLDARWFGVAQRRRRVFALSGPRTLIHRGIEVLLEPESSDRDTQPSATTGAIVAALTSTGVGTCGADDNQAQAGHVVPVLCATGDITHALTRSASKGASEDGTGRGTPIVPVSFGWQENSTWASIVDEPDGPVRTLETHKTPAVLYQDSKNGAAEYDSAGTLRAGQIPEHQMVAHGLAVRRLTPIECERLMGWPDNWTLHRHDGTTQADSHRYKQCGNGVVSNVTQWIGERLVAVADTSPVDERVKPPHKHHTAAQKPADDDVRRHTSRMAAKQDDPSDPDGMASEVALAFGDDPTSLVHQDDLVRGAFLRPPDLGLLQRGVPRHVDASGVLANELEHLHEQESTTNDGGCQPQIREMSEPPDAA